MDFIFDAGPEGSEVGKAYAQKFATISPPQLVIDIEVEKGA